MGICQELNSLYWPRMVTIINSGNLQDWVSDNILMQLPTPEDCINNTPLSPPIQAPPSTPIPSSSVVKATVVMVSWAMHRSISFFKPMSGT